MDNKIGVRVTGWDTGEGKGVGIRGKDVGRDKGSC
jgi:hypothetical protein